MRYLQYLQCFISSPSDGVVYILVWNVYFGRLFSQCCSVLVNFLFVCGNRRFYRKFLHICLSYSLIFVCWGFLCGFYEFVAALSILFWIVCIFLILDLQVLLQIGVAYIITGFIIVLYSSGLFLLVSSLFLQIKWCNIPLIYCAFSLIAWMWAVKLSLSSSSCGMSWLFVFS